MHNESDRPLIVEAEGRDQDERSALCAAVIRLLDRRDRRTVTDLHVFELIKWVHRLDKGKVGAQLSHYQIAKQLLVEVTTARAVVRRAVDELGLLLKSEQRYVSNGQQANRYEVNWTLVRSINRGDVPGDTRRQPPVTMCHPPVTTRQGPVTVCHPFKDNTGLLTESNSEPPPTPGQRACAENQEEEVKSFVVDEEASPRRSLDAGRKAPGEFALVRVAKPRGVLAPDQLVLAYRQANVYDATELLGWLLPEVGLEYLQRLLEYWQANKDRFDGAGALRVRLKRSRPDLAIDAGWPPPRPAVKPPPRGKTPEEYAAERAAFAEAKRVAQAAAAVDVPLAEQFKQRTQGAK